MTASLYEWGKWAKHDPNALGYQSPWLMIMRGKVQISDSSIRYNITNEEAVMVDIAVSKLGRFNSVLHAILCLRYIDGLSMKNIVLALRKIEIKVSKHDGWKMLSTAEGFVDACLHEEQHNER